MKNILVTGGAGFIGSHIVDELIKSKNNVIVLDDLSGGYKKNVNHNAKFIIGSINNKKLLEKIFIENNINYVFHLAAYAAEGLSHYIREFNYTNNLIGSINLINLSIKYNIKCFVYTSSIAVYGKNQLPMTEDLTPMPEDPYGISKLAVEQDLKAAHELFGLNYIIFRPHNVFGERQNLNDKYRNVIGIFIREILENKNLTVFGDGEQTRAFSYIKDVSYTISNSIKNKKAYNQIFNIGAEKFISINELIKKIKKIFNINNYPILYLTERKEVKHAYSSNNKIKKYFKYNESISIDEGIRNMINWSKTQKLQEYKKFKNIEITKKLPKIWKKNNE